MTRFDRIFLVCLVCATVAISAPAQSFKTITSFVAFAGYPQRMSFVQGADHELYGTASVAGGFGMVFKVSTAGNVTYVCFFGELDCPGGAYPFAGLIQGADGNFYGVAWQGYSHSGDPSGAGTVFQIPSAGQPVTLYGFCSQTKCVDGGDPFAPPLQATDGKLYGSTFIGGAKSYGTVYAITTSGTLTTLHSFRYTDGAGPVAGLIQAKDSNFYGTTLYGGAHDAGTVFTITAAGKLTTLHSFGAKTDGAHPYAAMLQASDGNFYGTTRDGGAHGQGTVYRITASGQLNTLYSFCSQKHCSDGASPYAGLIQASDGNLYGTASKGGASNWGTLYAITLAGQLTTLHSFCGKKNCADGADPLGGLLQASDGNLYGTTAGGGTYENGTVYRLSLGADQAAETPLEAAEASTNTFPPAQLLGRDAARSLPWLRRQLPHLDPSAHAPAPLRKPGGFNCSPAPCVLPPTQASEGGGIVTNPMIVSNPLNQKQLLLGSYDTNCPGSEVVGFHLSRDGGSTWNLVDCMPGIITKQRTYDATFEPSVVYDRKGNAYGSGFYFTSGLGYYGLLAVQKSPDGTHWNKPVIALKSPGQTFPYDTSLTADISPSSPHVNSVYVSGVMWSHQGLQKQVTVSHSTDSGTSWTQVAVDAAQKSPADESRTRMALGKDGTVYVTWMRCPGHGPDEYCSDGTGYMMFSKSSDGGNTWSAPRLITRVAMPPQGQLPNTMRGERVYDYPVIAADNSNGKYSGNLYVALYNFAGSYMQAQIIRSADVGKTWSKPVPVAPPTNIHDQFFPTVSVSPTGLVGVSWLDRRNDPGDLNYQTYAAISDDGGKTFKNWQLTKAFSDPDVNGTLNNWMGDYMGNTWSGNDFIAAWMDSSNGVDMQEVVGGVRLK